MRDPDLGQGLDFTEFDRKETEARRERVRQKGAGGFKCPKCDQQALVVDSRPSDDGVRRRRHCGRCGHRFTTYERVENTEPQQRDVTAAARRLILRVLANLPREGA